MQSFSRCIWSIMILAQSTSQTIIVLAPAHDSWGNWQYQAGVGNDARASRQFNPIKQAKDSDDKGEYIRLWLAQFDKVADVLVQTAWRECYSSSAPLHNQAMMLTLVSSADLHGYPNKPVVENPAWKKFYHGGKGGGGFRGRGNGRRGRGRGGHH